MKLINLTPHDVTLIKDGETKTYPSQGVARVRETSKQVGDYQGVPIYEVNYGEPEGLPKEKEGVFYIVSGLILSALRGKRNDLLSPYGLIRNDKGQVVGCKSFRK